MEPKRKRGRPPKIHKSPLLQSLEIPLTHLNETTARDLQYGYKILQEILNFPKSRIFLEKPDENLFGLHDYYEVIKHPMWLSEVSRKYDNKEYKELKDVVADFRLMLENCYRFWGANHKFSKHSFKIEKTLEKHLKELPGNLKSHGNLLIDDTCNDTSNESESALLDAYQSKILQNLGKKAKEFEYQSDICEEELLKWESEILINKQFKKQINFIAELADIGFFIKLTHHILCVKQITQYEIERMLLISRESSTLATLMTAFLCPTAMRGSLYLKPLMTYEVWTAILSKKLDSWYNAYMKCQHKIQIFLKYGIEPSFWEVVGDQNPLLTTEFHNLPLIKKTWILKTLCTTIFHSNKKIEEYFNSVEDTKLRGHVMYEDSKFVYINEFSPEIRVYRIGKQEGEFDNNIKELSPISINCTNSLQENGENNSLGQSKKFKFCLIAYDRESLELLTATFNRKKKSVLAVEKLLSTELNNKLSLQGLRSMYTQWKKFNERLPNVVENSKNYWIIKPASPSQALNAEGEADSTNNESGLIVFGKRPSKKKFSFQEVHSSSSTEEKLSEESISDWEDGNIRRSKRIRRSKSFPRQWERRYENGLYETCSRTHNNSHNSNNDSRTQNLTSKMSPIEFSNPNDYVSFLKYQQQKINSFYQLQKNGLTIRKTLISTNKKSIVSAAVETANKQIEIRKDLDETVKVVGSKVLMISMNNTLKNIVTSSQQKPNEQLQQNSLNIEIPKLQPQQQPPPPPLVTSTPLASPINNASSSLQIPKQSPIFPSAGSTKQLNVDNSEPANSPAAVQTFFTQWMVSKNLQPARENLVIPMTTKPISGDQQNNIPTA